MAGGFLSGLGQGLKGASGVLGDHVESRRQQHLLAQRDKEFQLSHELAQKEYALRQNQAGVDEMMAQHKADVDQQTLDEQRRYHNTSTGLNEMELMYKARMGDAANANDLLRTQGLNQYYQKMGNAAMARTGEDHFYDVQRLTAAMAPLERELRDLQDPMSQFMPGAEERASRAQILQMQLDEYQKEIRKSMGMGEPAALNLALQGDNPQPGALLSSPNPNAIPPQQEPIASRAPRRPRPNPNQVPQNPF